MTKDSSTLSKRPTLKLNLSSESLAKLNSRIPKAPESKKIEVEIPRKGSKLAKVNPINKQAIKAQKAKNKVKKTPPPPKPDTVQNSPLGYTQFWGILKTLQKSNPRCFPPKDKPARALKIGIHKDIAEIFKIPIPKAFNFVRIYFKVRKLHEVTIKGAHRYDLKGKKVGVVD